MSRRNLQRLFAITLVSLVCYQKADSAQRDRYGRMADTFMEALEQIEENYIDDVHRRDLFEAALSGMTDELDEHSTFVGTDAYDEFKENLEQQFGGIGIQVIFDSETRQLKVLSPLVGTPAYEAGILAGDSIVKIDGLSTADFTSADDAVGRLRGQPGEQVRLTIVHEGSDEEVDVDIERAIIQIDTVLGDVRNPDGTWNFFLDGYDSIGYLRVTSFSEKTIDELKAALAWLRDAGMKGLVLDMRNNPGGLLKAAVGMCDIFIPEGRIVSTHGRGGIEREIFDAQSNGTNFDVPTVVIVNRFSASASEIVAACLQDYGRAVVVGERTWGKGTVQNLIRLEGGRSALKLTVGTYWRPNGRNIHRRKNASEDEEWGVRPDPGHEVKLDQDAYRDLMDWRRQRDVVPRQPGSRPIVNDTARPSPADEDAQLAKALEYLDEALKHSRDELVERQDAQSPRAPKQPEPAGPGR